MRSWIARLAVLLAAGWAASGAVWKNATKVEIPADGVVLPMGTGASPVIDAYLDGQGPFPFILDTGCPVVMVDPELGRDLRPEILGTARSGDGGDYPSVLGIHFLARSVALRRAVFSGVQGIILSQTHADWKPVRGLMGLAMFADVLLTVDFPKREIRLTRGELDPSDPQVVPAEIADGRVHVAMAIGSTRFEALLDTGATCGIALPKAWAGRFHLSEPLRVVGQGVSIETRFTRWAAPIAGGVRIGNLGLPTASVEFQDRLPFALLGDLAMESLVVSIDQKNGLVRFGTAS